MSRQAERIHQTCPVCKRRIRNADRVVRLPRRGWVHVRCATAKRTGVQNADAR